MAARGAAQRPEMGHPRSIVVLRLQPVLVVLLLVGAFDDAFSLLLGRRGCGITCCCCDGMMALIAMMRFSSLYSLQEVAEELPATSDEERNNGF